MIPKTYRTKEQLPIRQGNVWLWRFAERLQFAAGSDIRASG